jgi:hypothetical protein
MSESETDLASLAAEAYVFLGGLNRSMQHRAVEVSVGAR